MIPEGPLTLVLSWVHPLIMLASIGMAVWVLRLGLRMRGARLRRQKRPKAWWRQHVRLARAAMWIGLVGLALGPLTWVFVREEALLSSLHGRAGLATAAVATCTWLVGRRLERGRSRQLGLHATLGIGTVLAAVVALLTGLELLP